MARTWRKIANEFRVLARARRHRTDLLSHLVRRPALLAGTAGYESGLLLSSRVDTRLKILAQTKVSALVGCHF